MRLLRCGKVCLIRHMFHLRCFAGWSFSRILVLSFALGAGFAPEPVAAQLPKPLPGAKPLAGTQPLFLEGDLSAQMVAGIDRFLRRELEQSVGARQKLWQRDFSSNEAYEKSVAGNRERFRKYIGVVDARVPVTALEYVSSTSTSAKAAETDGYTVYAVRWPVLAGVQGEGLFVQPKRTPVARVVVLPDADQTPEMLLGLAPGLPPEAQLARRLAEQGCQVIIPTLIDRQDTGSGNALVGRFTNQPHREWIYRQAYEMGRHVIGYEVQKVLAAVDWFSSLNQALGEGVVKPRIGVAGYAEGGLIALYSAAVDTRINATLVSGYFDARQKVWQEPIYRNVFALLQEFGDAEIASLVAPRSLVIEYSAVPKITGPPAPRDGRAGAAPGTWETPDFISVELEVQRARTLLAEPGRFAQAIRFVYGNEGTPVGPGSVPALQGFMTGLGWPARLNELAATTPVELRAGVDVAARQLRQMRELEAFTQELLRRSEKVRADRFWNKARPTPTNDWVTARRPFQEDFWTEVIGRLPAPNQPANPRTRQIYDEPKWTGYEVVLEVWPDVFAWGYLLVPKDLQPGERRPVVVCQHGLEGVPEDTVTEDPKSSGFRYYSAFAAKLAERGFITFAPHNPYRGKDNFRVLQRKANPLKASLFSVILGQHERILDWLAEQQFVDPARIGFYGLSYGGKSAMRLPALLDRYALSICSADFNEWITKNVTVEGRYSYMFTGEYEMPEFNLGHTYNYAEMAMLIAPRPFMVERGHHDGVAPDEWVAYEFSKVRRHYTFLGIPERATIEYFNGPHSIHGVGTYEFLHQHLNWPKPR